MLSLLVLLTVAQPAVDSPSTAPSLTIQQAVTTAKKQHPSLSVARARTMGADARADQARAPLRPSLDASGRFSASTSSPFNSQFNNRTSYSGGLSGSILVYDFDRTKNRLEAAKTSAIAQKFSETGVAQDVALDARVAFINARAAKDLVVIAKQRLANEQRHLKQSEAFVEVGTRPAIDLAKAKTLVANAKAAVAQTENNYEIAKARLNAAMGVSGSTDYDVADTKLSAIEGENGSASELYNEAVTNRPELAAAKADIRAQQLTLEASKKGLHPSVRLGTDLSVGGSDLNRPNWTAGLGLSISFSLFDGGANDARVRSDRANLMALNAQKQNLDQQTWLAVEQSRLAVRSAKAELLAANEGHEAAKELLTLAEGRYQQGAGNAIELSDAQLVLTNAASRQVQATFKLETARAQLLRTLGRTSWT